MALSTIGSAGLDTPLGVGTASPSASAKITIANAGNQLYFQDTRNANGATGLITYNQDGNFYYDANTTQSATNGGHTWRTQGNQTMYLSSSGKLFVGTASSSGWGNSTTGVNAGGVELGSGPLNTNYILSSTYSPSKTIYVEAPYHVSTSISPNGGLMSYVYRMPNGGPSGLSYSMCYTSWSYGWLQDFCIIEVFQDYYLNGGYRRYQYYSGYQPTFAEVTGYAHGATDISLSNTWIGQYQNGTTNTPGTATDVTYWKGRLDVSMPAYKGGFIRITTNKNPVQTMNSSYQMQFI